MTGIVVTSTATPHQRVAQSLERQGMMNHLGVRLLSAVVGQVELAVPYSDNVTQQQGGFHGGAIGALADIAGGYAALTVAPEGMEVVTIEYKINFLNSLQGGEIRATGKVLKAGRRVIVTTAEVVHIDANGHVNNVVYVGWLQDAGTAHWNARFDDATRARWSWVGTRHEIDYFRPLMPDSVGVVARTWVGDPQGPRFNRYVRIEDGEGRLCAQGLSNALIRVARHLEIGHVAFADKHEWLDRHRFG